MSQEVATLQKDPNRGIFRAYSIDRVQRDYYEEEKTGSPFAYIPPGVRLGGVLTD